MLFIVTTFKMSGTVNITENKVGTTPNNLYLWNGQQVSASGLTSGAEIGVTTQIVPINDSSVPITSDSVSVNCFFLIIVITKQLLMKIAKLY